LASTGISSLDELLGDGYPDRSSILVTGPSGIGKEALAYWFARSGLVQNDFCFYVTHRPVPDVLRGMRSFGIASERLPEWMASSGSDKRCDLNDSTSISFNIKQALISNKDRRIRIVTDVLSPLLLLNPMDSMYRYWTQLIGELKQYDAILLALMDEGMHQPSVIASMEQLFDSVIEMRIYEQGLSLTTLLRVKKMLGLQPLQGYFKFSFTKTGMEIDARVANISK
jgi:KaiC/GvpD/RAD55 family RecA-like ATPase